MTLERISNTEQNRLAVTLGTYGHEDYRSMIISHGSLESAASLTFERTLRVPDNHDVNGLPPSLGQFPLFSVAEYKQHMPEDMASKGGVFLPMYQREAMWIRFSAKEPFALKVYVGGVNAISGVSINETAEALFERLKLSEQVKQDYVILPEQPWLDGIASEDGKIRQFVAMPKGSGYSVEAQITGEEKIGGLQFELTPVKRKCPATLKISLSGGRYQHMPGKEIVLKLHEKGLGDTSTISDLKRVIETEFEVSPSNQALRLLKPSFTSISSDIGNENLKFSEIWISEDHVLQVRDTSIKASDTSQLARSRGSAKAFLHGAMAKESSQLSEYAPVSAYSLEEGSVPTSSMAVNSAAFSSLDTATAKSYPASYTASSPSLSKPKGLEKMSTQSRGGSVPPPPPKIEAMGLAAGGLILQSINEDTYPASVWDSEASILFNVQLLNSESFIAVTGLAPPTSPIDAKTYAQYGYPFFQIWDEELSGIKGNFDKVKSVGAMDEEVATKEKSAFWKKLSGATSASSQQPFKRDESIQFPIVMLDMSHRRTFKPLKEMEEESVKLKGQR